MNNSEIVIIIIITLNQGKSQARKDLPWHIWANGRLKQH